MSEEAPGIFVTNFVRPGSALIIDARPWGGPERGIAMSPEDWRQVPPAQRERILDEVTRNDAERGLAELQRFLSAAQE